MKHNASDSHRIKVSVIIPVYNMARYLPKCLDSIVAQTLSPIEIIAVNDGSADDSLTILEQYAVGHDNFVIFSQENQGAGPAKNSGIRMASGKYLIFMDPDDWYPAHDCLEALYRTAEEKQAAVCGGIIVKDRYGEKEIKKTMGGSQMAKLQQIGYAGAQEAPVCYGYQSYLFRTDLIRENTLYFPAYRRFEDPPFMLKVLLCAGGRYGINKEVYTHRFGHKETVYSLENSIDVLHGIRDVIQMAKENDLRILYENSLKYIHKQYSVVFYAYSYCGHAEIDNMLREIAGMVADWIGPEEELVLTRDKIIRMKKDCQREYQDFVRILRNADRKIIYGAGMKAHALIERHQNDMQNVLGVAVSRKQEGAEDSVCGLPVKDIKEYLNDKEDSIVLIATMLAYQKEIEEYLQTLGFRHVVKLDMAKLDLAQTLAEARSQIVDETKEEKRGKQQ